MAQTRMDEEDIERSFAEANALFCTREFGRAAALLQALLADAPDHPRALHALGAIACERGAYEEASDYVSRALELDPAYASACNSMGNILRASGKETDARSWYARALELDPHLAVACYNLGIIDLNRGELDSAAGYFEQAIALQPADIQPIFYLGIARMKMGAYEEALSQFQKVVLLDPSCAQAWIGASEVHRKYNRSVDAEKCCRKGLAVASDHPVLLSALGSVLLEQGRVAEAEECHRRVLALDSSMSGAYTSLMFTMNYDPCATQEDIHSLAVIWDRSCCAAIPRFTGFANPPDPERPLRIGYVSADLHCHPVGFHLLPVLRNHDRRGFQVYCYYNSFTGDDMTREFIELSDCWRVIGHCSDEAAAELIRADGIDILVDLSGHTAFHRLQLFARKPAPVQATWLGYFNTTGLSAIDYLITDDATVLPGEERWFSEKVVRLPWSRFCFTPYAHLPDVLPPPCLANGHVTFGCFNTLAKVNQEVVALWSRILRELPGSRLILKRGELGDPQVRQRFSDLFAAEGIDSERLEFRDASPYAKMLAEYGDVDIALDTFPFSGGLTTLDALLMGVPVVTLSGHLPISRQTRAFLRVLNLLELVARSADRYCAIVADLARDPRRLADLRSGLRARMMNSYLCNGKDFTRNLEQGYRTMWRDWCTSEMTAPNRKGV